MALAKNLVTLRVVDDEDPRDPMEDGGSWTLYSFCTRHLHFKDPDAFLDGVPSGGNWPWNAEVQAKLESGLAFELSYFEHGSCIWGLRGELSGCPDFRWDGVDVAGLLVWENVADDMGAKTYRARQADAAGFLREYTSWANGDAHGWVVEDAQGCHLDSCYGYLGDDIERGVEDALEQYPGAVAGDDLTADVMARVRRKAVLKRTKEE